MNKDTTITFELSPSVKTAKEQMIESALEIAGKSVDLCLNVPDMPARIADLVSIAQTIAEKVCDVTVEQHQLQKRPIACHKGCSACCSYLVAVSRPEVTYLREQLSRMDQDYQDSVQKACVESAQKILHNSSAIHEISQHDDPQQLSRWYASLKLKCPFLINDTCGIYEHRPLACREHLVCGDAKLCDSTRPGRPEVIEPPVSVLEALGQLDAELNQSDVEAVILPLALIEMDNSDEPIEPRWNPVEMVNRLLTIIEDNTANTAKH